jgi:DNA (cytosine-5)-methyltransferase 1
LTPVAIEIFSGAGGTGLGLEWAGFDTRVAAEIDREKADIYSKNHPNAFVFGSNGTEGDVRRLTGQDLASRADLGASVPDLLVGCPPCQGFSLRGKRDPNDPRNYLYLEFVRIADELRSRAIVFENVPGIVSLKGGAFLRDLLSRLKNIGYETAIWTLRASDFGVPQARNRVFVVGLRDHKPGDEPKKKRGRKPDVWKSIADLPTTSAHGLGKPSKFVSYRGPPLSHYARFLRGSNTTVDSCEKTRHEEALVKRFRHIKWGRMDKATYHRRLHPHEPAPTITAGSRTLTSCRPVHPYADRVLTVREAARLASFPDRYSFSPMTAEAWSQIGNAVPPLMAQAVFCRIKSFLFAA